ncbi:hypothetical protein XENTR_v10019345 [Xenopus tropicalis]|nr:hypothetical protein XENTR_v10019345 [Xenopus tropicalis]
MGEGSEYEGRTMCLDQGGGYTPACTSHLRGHLAMFWMAVQEPSFTLEWEKSAVCASSQIELQCKFIF